MKKEKIGNVSLYLPDNERSREDDANLKKLKKIIKTRKESEYHGEVVRAASWPVMYELAETRANLMEWMEFPKHAHVLELEAGCGTLTSALLKKDLVVYAVSDDVAYARLNAERHQQSERLTVYGLPLVRVVRLMEKKGIRVDVVLAAGYAQVDEGLLKTVSPILKDDALFVIAAENKFGLKYWAGNVEEQTGAIFAGLDRTAEQTIDPLYTCRGIKEILGNSGFDKCRFYYPYPDWRFPLSIYSDDYLPRQGELSENINNYDHDRVILFDEKNVFDNILKEKLFPVFTNSYLCVAGRGQADVDRLAVRGGSMAVGQKKERIVYSRYSSERARRFAIRTEICYEDASEDFPDHKRILVRKVALYPEGDDHVRGILDTYEALTREYEKSGLLFNVCRSAQKETGTAGRVRAELEYIEGTTLQSMLEEAIEERELGEVYDMLRRLIDAVRSSAKNVPFVHTEAFREVFGDVPVECLEGMPCCAVSDIDLILGNIIVDAEGRWNVIDYEWTFRFPIPQNFIIFRTLFYIAHAHPDDTRLSMFDLCQLAGISGQEKEAYQKMEEHFQNHYIMGDAVPYREMVNILDRRYFDVTQLMVDYQRVRRQNEVLKGKALWKVVRKLKHCFAQGRDRGKSDDKFKGTV